MKKLLILAGIISMLAVSGQAQPVLTDDFSTFPGGWSYDPANCDDFELNSDGDLLYVVSYCLWDKTPPSSIWEFINQDTYSPIASDDDFCLIFKPIATEDLPDQAGGIVVQLLDEADNIVALLSWTDKDPDPGYGGITAKIEDALVYGEELKCDSEYPTINDVLKICREGDLWSVWVGEALIVDSYNHPVVEPIVKVKIGFFDLPATGERDIKVDFIELMKSGQGGNIIAPTVIEPDSMFTAFVHIIDFEPIKIYIGDIPGGYVAGDINPASLVINGTVTPTSTAVIPSHPAFTGDVLEITVPVYTFVSSYPDWWDWSEKTYNVVGAFGNAVTFSASGLFDARGHISGDVNNDGLVNMSDIVYLVNYVYLDGPPPKPRMETGDYNHDGNIDLSDILNIITEIYFSPTQ